MLIIHTILALGAVFNTYLYIVKPPHANRASIIFKDNLTHWTEMEVHQLDGIDVFKHPLNTSLGDMITFKIKFFFTSGYARESTWQTLWNNDMSYLQTLKDNNNICKATLTVCIIILCLLSAIYMLHLYAVHRYNIINT